ncbi:hypothetical protein Tco_0682414 [Tanacetum coccineum]|uniref:Uncharacterized protein n=1 Tax=Tanacetum coccineum TaxID=301880 RepID=A0ABQ4XR26_9ASTR
MIVMTSIIELESISSPLFDEYFNGENQVASKSFVVTTADASDKRQQQPDSTSFTSTLVTTVTADGNFDIVIHFSIHIDDGTPSSVIIKQHCRSEWVREVLGLSSNVGLEALSESLNIPKGSQDKDNLKVLTKLPRSLSMKVLALLVGSLVIVVMKNEGALLHFHDMGKDHGMRKRKKRCKFLQNSKAEDEANVEDTTYPRKEDGLDSLSFMAWVKAALMTLSDDMLIRLSGKGWVIDVRWAWTLS